MKIIKIFFSMSLAFSLVSFFTPKIFIGSTPRVNPYWAINLTYPIQSLAKRIMPSSSESVALGEPLSFPPPAGLVFNQFVSGVEAAEDQTTKTIYLKIDKNIRFESRLITLSDGTQVKIVNVSN